MNTVTWSGAPVGRARHRVPSDRLAEANEKALSRRPFLDPSYEFRPVSVHEEEFHAIKRRYPYFGYVDVEVEGVAPFLMFNNNDDQVAQTYFWYGPNSFESLSLRVWRDLARRAEHIFDIGAFTGVYSLTAAHANRDAQVYSLEPIKRIFGRLVVNLSVNRLGQRIKAHNLALSDADDCVEMKLAQGYLNLDSGASLIEKSGKEIALRERVETARFDTFARTHSVPTIDLAKIDVEQAEKMVITGMSEALLKHHPNLLIEVVSQENLQDLADTLSPHGYNFAVIDDSGQKLHLNDGGAHRVSANVLFTAMPSDELYEFCRSFESLLGGQGGKSSHSMDGRRRRQRISDRLRRRKTRLGRSGGHPPPLTQR